MWQTESTTRQCVRYHFSDSWSTILNSCVSWTSSKKKTVRLKSSTASLNSVRKFYRMSWIAALVLRHQSRWRKWWGTSYRHLTFSTAKWSCIETSSLTTSWLTNLADWSSLISVLRKRHPSCREENRMLSSHSGTGHPRLFLEPRTTSLELTYGQSAASWRSSCRSVPSSCVATKKKFLPKSSIFSDAHLRITVRNIWSFRSST